MEAIIIGNGDIRDYDYLRRYIKPPVKAICADGGMRHMSGLGLTPAVLLGDFDSISKDDLAKGTESGIEIIRYPVKKDMTDMEIAVEYAMDGGAKSIVIIGGLGSRADHSIANILLLKKILDRGVKGMIADENNEIRLLNDRITITREKDFKISLIPIDGNAEGVTTHGLYYRLEDATLVMGGTLGISNEFLEERAEISVRRGLLLVVKSRD